MSEPSSLQRVLDVVSLVSLRGGLTAREIGEAVGLPKSTSHRMVGGLVKAGLLQSHPGPDGDTYTVGGLVEEWGTGELSWRSLLQQSRAPMDALRDRTGETVGLHILFTERRVLLAQAVSPHPHRWVYDNVMVPRSLHGGAAAKMLLAMLPDVEMERLAVRDYRQASGGASPGLDHFLEGLRQIRSADVSVTADEVNPGIASVAIPVIRNTHHGHPLAVLSLVAPAIRLTPERIDESLPALRKTAQQIVQACASSVRGGAVPRRLASYASVGG